MKIKQIWLVALIAVLTLLPVFAAADEAVGLVQVKTALVTEADEAPAPDAQAEESAAPADEPAVERWIGTVKLTSGNLNIRKGPSTDDQIIGKFPNGAKVEVLEIMEEWVKIPFDESIAYVSKPYLVIAKETGKQGATGGKVVVLDPGHGGRDPGAIASDKTYESNLVYQYALKAKEKLEASGYTVHLTRSENSSCTEYKDIYDELGCRSKFAQKVNGDIYISIHADANPVKSFRGTVTFYNARNDLDGRQNPYPAESKRLAELIQSQVQPAMGSTDRGTQDKNYYVNRMNSVPAVLIELGVMTNAADLKLLKSKDRPDKFAGALAKAIDQYFKSN